MLILIFDRILGKFVLILREDWAFYVQRIKKGP